MDPEQQRLTFSTGGNVGSRLPAWSNDGKQIAFSSNKDGNWEIFIMNADGKEIKQLTLTDKGINNFNADWSPDGLTISFDSDRLGNWEIYSVHSDGTGLKQLTQTGNEKNSGNPEWSPDGKSIVFQSDRDRNATNFDETDIYIMDAYGKNIQRITNEATSKSSWTPIWSIDGSRILFGSNRDGKSNADYESEIYTMKSDGSDIRRVTKNDHDDLRPHWSTDGKMIVFHAPSNSNVNEDIKDWEVYIMKSDGSNIKRLTNNDSADGHPNW